MTTPYLHPPQNIDMQLKQSKGGSFSFWRSLRFHTSKPCMWEHSLGAKSTDLTCVSESVGKEGHANGWSYSHGRLDFMCTEMQFYPAYII